MGGVVTYHLALCRVVVLKIMDPFTLVLHKHPFCNLSPPSNIFCTDLIQIYFHLLDHASYYSH